jgi:uncharacterized membrane-anchored protein
MGKSGRDEDINTGAQAIVLGFPAHSLRGSALGEVHARPHPLISAPRLIIQVAFLTEGGFTVDHAVLAGLSRAAGLAAPDRAARHHIMPSGSGTLRWERHTEFSTYLYEGPLENGNAQAHPFGSAFKAPGAVLSGIRLEIRKQPKDLRRILSAYDPASTCCSTIEDGAATIITDFHQDADGLTGMTLLDNGLSPVRTGALGQMLIEVETYRTFAMLGLPLAQSLSPRIRRIEDRMAVLTREMRDDEGRESERLLSELSALAAELEADAASSLYRFGASKAYDGIVAERLNALDETPVKGFETWAAFLQKRMAPAMRTCRSVEERQANLSRKLTRATTLLRTWVDVDLEKQNSALLTSMNQRARSQLRLQQTVEGLSVAAVSYYVVGLFSYLAKGMEKHLPFLSSNVATALFVPVAILAIWLMVRRIRLRHDEHDESINKPD